MEIISSKNDFYTWRDLKWYRITGVKCLFDSNNRPALLMRAAVLFVLFAGGRFRFIFFHVFDIFKIENCSI